MRLNSLSGPLSLPGSIVFSTKKVSLPAQNNRPSDINLKTGPRKPVTFGSKKSSRCHVVRLVLKGEPKPDAAADILHDAFAQWPKHLKTTILATPGGFTEAPWPQNWQGNKGWQSQPRDMDNIILEAAESAVNRVMTKDVLKAARGKADYITLGIDLVSEKGMKAPHMELVAVFDVKKGKVAGWTGKSFPTGTQENHLVQVADLNSHCFILGNERVLVLGCNDLNLFSPRVMANASPHGRRGKMSRQMQAIAKAFRPTMILQHPHATDTPNIWRVTWKHTERLFTNLKTWASAIRYYNPNGTPRKPLESVLRLTRQDNQPVYDLVIDTEKYPSAPSRYFQSVERF